MPLYAYRCTQCGHGFEKIQNFSAQPESVCPKCGGALERPLTAPALQFKGAGWYINDYAPKPSSSANTDKAGSDGAASGGDSKPTESKPAATESSAASGSRGANTSGSGASSSDTSGSGASGSSSPGTSNSSGSSSTT